MTAEDPDRDERELRALFDRTAERLDGPGLTKLRARALDVPRAARRRPWWLVFAPLGAVALGALIVVLLRAGPRSEPIANPRTPSPQPSALAVQSAHPPSPSATEPPEPGGDDSDLESPEVVAELPGMSDDESNGNDLFAALDEPAEEDVDAWLAATSAYLEGG